MNKKNKIIYFLYALAFFALTVIVYLFFTANNTPRSGMDLLASCIEDSGAKFYGTRTCTYCKSQKSSFGESAKFLPYVECTGPGGRGPSYICKDNKIESYPTWVFADGSRLVGELSFEKLAEKTGCGIPGN